MIEITIINSIYFISGICLGILIRDYYVFHGMNKYISVRRRSILNGREYYIRRSNKA